MRRLIGAFVIGVVLCLCVVTVILIRGVKHMTWMDYAPSEINRLAIAVEVYKEENSHYPVSLSDLKSLKNFQDKQFLMELLAENKGNQYHYQIVSNGFDISVAKPANLLSKGEFMQKHFEAGNIFGDKFSIKTETSFPTNKSDKTPAAAEDKK